MNPIDLVTNAIGGSSASNPNAPIILSSPELKLGVDLSIREQEVILSEGDSMQGSHYCSQIGTYILQWRLKDQASTSQHHTSFDFSLSGPKCKVMYYYELLDSQNFKGSVASLESCRSSFSSLAALEGQTKHTRETTPVSSTRPKTNGVDN
jgi:hypothetical protein